jgi:hypothetical protein
VGAPKGPTELEQLVERMTVALERLSHNVDVLVAMARTAAKEPKAQPTPKEPPPAPKGA